MRPGRSSIRGLALASLLAIIPARAARPRASAQLPGVDATFRAADGWALHARYLAARDQGRQTLVLLHGRGMRKEFWLPLARALRKAGYGYLALDLRGHGQSATGPDGKPATWRHFKVSKERNDYEGMDLDVQAAVAWLEAARVPQESIGLIGQGLGGSVAVKYAALHPKVAPLALLSPGLDYEDIPIVNAIRAYTGRPILMVYGELDRTASEAVPILAAFARHSAGERETTVVSLPAVHGDRLLTPALAARIVAWLEAPVAPEAPRPDSLH